MSDCVLTCRHFLLNLCADLVEQDFKIGRSSFRVAPVEVQVGEQIAEKSGDVSGAVNDIREKQLLLAGELLVVLLGEDVGRHGKLPDGLLQVMGTNIGQLSQVVVRA